MSDDEDYNSASDEDYVPSDGEQVSEEEGSGDDEDLDLSKKSDGTEKVKPRSKKRQRKNTSLDSRKRRGGIKLDEEEGESIEDESNLNNDVNKCTDETTEDKEDLKEKKKADNLWASFLSDVGHQPKRTPPASKPVLSPLMTAKKTGSTESTPQKVTITKVFDFAGEEIKVTKEVDIHSKEAKDELQKSEEKNVESSSNVNSPSGPPSVESRVSPGISGSGIKRVGSGLGSVLSKINKKPKIGTLEKSKLDWDSFKREKGIDDELKIHNRGKDGYIERLNFLSRTDHRQFEIEKNLRQSSSKR